ncbi:MAG TPA: 6-phosphofructokinase, partial [Clostridiaceae bacterium]|nr:6-phosphofructokinase [Clostridiaceae bacterium]
MTDELKSIYAPWTEDSNIRTVGVLTSGGDAPGMNAAIRSVVRSGLHRGYQMLGVRRGFHGLWRGDIMTLDARSVSEKLQRGGTFLMTARSKTFTTPEGVQKAYEMCRVFGIDALVVIGGDGSMRGANDLAQLGMPVICVPGTIDNDIGCSEYTIGYDTAMNTAMNAIDKLRDTASSHERCSCIEVMGRRAGYIALNVGMSCGAEVILVPEVEMDFDQHVVRRLLDCRNQGKHHYIVVVAEGVGDTMEIAKRIESTTGIQSRVTILGHLQRGGSPTIRDRMMASYMGAEAINCIAEGKFGRIIALKDGNLVDVDLVEGLQMKKTISE